MSVAGEGLLVCACLLAALSRSNMPVHLKELVSGRTDFNQRLTPPTLVSDKS